MVNSNICIHCSDPGCMLGNKCPNRLEDEQHWTLRGLYQPLLELVAEHPEVMAEYRRRLNQQAARENGTSHTFTFLCGEINFDVEASTLEAAWALAERAVERMVALPLLLNADSALLAEIGHSVTRLFVVPCADCRLLLQSVDGEDAKGPNTLDSCADEYATPRIRVR